MAFMALLPVTGHLRRLVAALEKTPTASKGVHVRLDKNQQEWREWYPRFEDARKRHTKDSEVIEAALKSYIRDVKTEQTRLEAVRATRRAHGQGLGRAARDQLTSPTGLRTCQRPAPFATI